METNNISTIATFIAICITGIVGYFGYSVDQAQLATGLMSIITLIIAVWSSHNPNTLKCFGNELRPPYDIDNPVLNEEYVTGDEDDDSELWMHTWGTNSRYLT